MSETLEQEVKSLSNRLDNNIEANIDAIAHFLAQHPELSLEHRTTFMTALQLAAVKLTALARCFIIEEKQRVGDDSHEST